jgi:hypothetical protein
VAGEADEVLEPRGAQWAGRAVPGMLVLAFVAAAALAGPPAAATGRSGQEQIHPKTVSGRRSSARRGWALR